MFRGYEITLIDNKVLQVWEIQDAILLTAGSANIRLPLPAAAELETVLREIRERDDE